MIQDLILVIIVMGVFFISSWLYIKKRDNFTEKILDVLIIAILFIPLLIYFLDYFNAFTVLKLSENINTQNWLSFLASYSSSVIGSFFSGIILYLVTKMQIDKNNKDAKIRDNENLRLQNLPLLKYDFVDESSLNSEPFFLQTNIKKSQSIDLNLKIQNIGSNTIRKLYIKIQSDILVQPKTVLKDQQISIEKNGEETISFLLNLSPDKYKFIFTIYYQDLMFNWYEQIINLNYELTNIVDNNKKISIKKLEVTNEKLLK